MAETSKLMQLLFAATIFYCCNNVPQAQSRANENLSIILDTEVVYASDLYDGKLISIRQIELKNLSPDTLGIPFRDYFLRVSFPETKHIGDSLWRKNFSFSNIPYKTYPLAPDSAIPLLLGYDSDIDSLLLQIEYEVMGVSKLFQAYFGM